MCSELCCWTGRLKTVLASGLGGVEGPEDLAAAIPAEASGKSHPEVGPECGILLGYRKQVERVSVRTRRDCDNGGKKEENKGMRQCSDLWTSSSW